MTCCRRAAATIYIVFFVHLIWWLSASSGGIFCLGREFSVVHGSCAWRSRLGAMSLTGDLREPRDSNVGILENKSTLLTISWLWRYCGPSNYRLNFLLYWYAPWVSRWGATKNSAVALSSRNNMICIHQMSTRTNEGKTTLVVENCVMNGFIIFGIMFMTATGLENSPQYLASTLFHSLVPRWPPRRIRPQITRLSQLENSATGTWQFTRTLSYQTGSKNGVI